METPSPELDAWLKAQDGHTRDLLGAVPGRARLRDELHEANRATDRIDVIKVVGERPRVFAMHQTSTDESPKLVTLDGWNSAERVLVDPNDRAGGDSHVTVDSAYPSPDGTYVAYVVATAGSEDGTVEIVDVRSGRILSDRIDRVQEPMISWRADGRSFFYWRRPKASADTPPADWYKNSAAYVHTLGDDPDVEVPVISARTSGLGLQAHDIPWITTNPGTRWVVATAMRNVSETSFFAASSATVKPGSTRWRRVARADDKVVSVLARANRLYALTFADAPNYRIVSFDARSGTVATAQNLVEESEIVLVDLGHKPDTPHPAASRVRRRAWHWIDTNPEGGGIRRFLHLRSLASGLPIKPLRHAE